MYPKGFNYLVSRKLCAYFNPFVVKLKTQVPIQKACTGALYCSQHWSKEVDLFHVSHLNLKNRTSESNHSPGFMVIASFHFFVV
jgi:hypothetical protein